MYYSKVLGLFDVFTYFCFIHSFQRSFLLTSWWEGHICALFDTLDMAANIRNKYDDGNIPDSFSLRIQWSYMKGFEYSGVDVTHCIGVLICANFAKICAENLRLLRIR